MNKLFKKKILKSINEFYIKSGDFNGIPVNKLLDEFECEWAKLKLKLRDLIREEKITLVFGMFGNPHIKVSPDLPLTEQENYLISAFENDQICAYPTESVILSYKESLEFNDRPFTKMVLLGDPQVYPTLFFEMKVLERYYNNPKYICCSSDYRGYISLAKLYSDDPNTPKRDKVIIEFGLGYDNKNNKVITVPLRRLYRLPPEQQQYWKSYILYNNEYNMSESYYKNIRLGKFADGVSIYKAFIKEQEIINDMCKLMNKPNLFRKTFEDGRPKDFGIILSPTRRNYLSFIHVLDKMLFDNLNKKYFRNDIDLKEETELNDGKIIVNYKNPLHLLDEWLRTYIIVEDEKIFDEIIDNLKEVRRIRQEPAHLITDDEFDNEYWGMQYDIIGKVYKSLRYIRLLFALHPAIKDYKVPTWLYEGRIENY